MAGEVEDYRVSVYLPTLRLELVVNAPHATPKVPAVTRENWIVRATSGIHFTPLSPIHGSGFTDPKNAQAGVPYRLETTAKTTNAGQGYTMGTWQCGPEPQHTVHPTAHYAYSSRLNGSTLLIANQDRVLCTIEVNSKPGSLSWSKVDKHTGEYLPDTAWAFSGPSYPASINVTDCTTAPCTGHDIDPKVGRFTVDNLKWGNYRVKETATPEGYALNPNTFEFPLVEPANLNASLIDPIPNTPLRTPIRWSKVGPDGATALGGSRWEWFDPSGRKITVDDCMAQASAQCAGADKDPAAGRFLIYTTQSGSYRLKELNAPIGYAVKADAIRGNIYRSEFGRTVQLGAVVNYPITPPPLPFTGGTSADAFLLVGGGSLSTALLAAAYRRRQQSKL